MSKSVGGNQDPYTFVALSGHEDSEEIRVAIETLGRLGLDPRVVRDYKGLFKDALARDALVDPTNLEPDIYPIDSITSRDDWLGKEHFLSYRDRYGTHFHRLVASKVYNAVTAKGNYRMPNPWEAAIKHRSLTPLETLVPAAYARPTAPVAEHRAIQVDWFLTHAMPMMLGNLDGRSSTPWRTGAQCQQFTVEMAEWLERRTAYTEPGE